MKNPEISEIAISPQSHNPTIPQSHNPRVFSPGAPAENLGGGRLIPRIRGEIKGRAAGETLLRKMVDCNEEFMQ